MLDQSCVGHSWCAAKKKKQTVFNGIETLVSSPVNVPEFTCLVHR